MHAKRQPARDTSRLIPYICLGTALGRCSWIISAPCTPLRSVPDALGEGGYSLGGTVAAEAYEVMYLPEAKLWARFKHGIGQDFQRVGDKVGPARARVQNSWQLLSLPGQLFFVVVGLGLS